MQRILFFLQPRILEFLNHKVVGDIIKILCERKKKNVQFHSQFSKFLVIIRFIISFENVEWYRETFIFRFKKLNIEYVFYGIFPRTKNIFFTRKRWEEIRPMLPGKTKFLLHVYAHFYYIICIIKNSMEGNVEYGKIKYNVLKIEKYLFIFLYHHVSSFYFDLISRQKIVTVKFNSKLDNNPRE